MLEYDFNINFSYDYSNNENLELSLKIQSVAINLPKFIILSLDDGLFGSKIIWQRFYDIFLSCNPGINF